MSASTTTRPESSTPVQLPGSIVLLLRLEGLAIATATGLLYARTGASWWLFAEVWLAPDLSMLGYLAGPCRGSRIYNAFHTYLLPITLGIAAVVLRANAVVPFALVWANHISVDRLLGYGLKYSAGFGWTHLGRSGRLMTAVERRA